jgi:hypothetical protein
LPQVQRQKSSNTTASVKVTLSVRRKLPTSGTLRRTRNRVLIVGRQVAKRNAAGSILLEDEQFLVIKYQIALATFHPC